MDPDLFNVMLAMALFVGSHFMLTSLPVRSALVEAMGEKGFRILFSAVAGGTLLWAGISYGKAPYIPVWDAGPGMRHIPLAIMPIVTVLFVCSLTTRNATSVGGEKFANDPNPAPGIMSITRHPMLVSFALWALAHLCANGGLADIVLFGGILVLALGGIHHIDRRRQASLGSDWGPIAIRTSAIPFLAVIQGRTRIDWHGIGLWRVALGVVLYVVLAFAHPWFAGVAIVPGG